MRFGRRNKNWAFLRRQPDDESQQPQSGQVAGEERSALLGGGSAPGGRPLDQGANAFALGANSLALDAVQELQTALVRFNSALIRAKEGAADGIWPAECMNELVTAVETAVEYGWREVLKALTDTGRVLQSYENAGQPSKALPFLTESHRQLARMAADLSSGSLRVGAANEWRTHYLSGVDALARDGVALVTDDDEGGEHDLDADANEDEAPDYQGLEDDTPFVLPDDAPSAGNRAVRQDDLPTLDDLPPLAMTDALGHEPVQAEPAPVQAAAPPVVSPEEGLPPLEAFGEASYLLSDAGDDDPAERDPRPASGEDSVKRPPKEVENALDTFCAELAALESRSPEARDASGLYQYVARLTQFANGAKAPAAESMCHAMTVICQLAAESPAVRDADRFFELAYGFCEAYVDAYTGEGPAAAEAWRHEAETFAEASVAFETEPVAAPFEDEDDAEEDVAVNADAADAYTVEDEPGEPAGTTPVDDEYCDDRFSSAETQGEFGIELEDALAWQDEPTTPLSAFEDGVELDLMTEAAMPAAVQDEEPEAGAGEAAEPVVDEESVEGLLETARRAMAAGAVGDAKQLALRAAAQIAIVEAEKAEAHLHESETRLRESGEAIEAARVFVKQVETEVGEAEQRVEEGLGQLEQKRREAARVTEELQQIQAGIAALDAQIRELQARKEAESARAEATRQSLETRHEEERQTAAALDTLRDAERGARERLEDARQNVKLVQHRRTEAEAAVVRARDALVVQRESVASLERTMAQMLDRGKRAGESQEQTLF